MKSKLRRITEDKQGVSYILVSILVLFKRYFNCVIISLFWKLNSLAEWAYILG